MSLTWLWYILIGIAAGYIASLITKKTGTALLLNLLIGLIGGVVGGWLFELLASMTRGMVGGLLAAVVGAFFLVWLASNLLKGSKK